MRLAQSSPRPVYVPLSSLPVAAAGLQQDGTIVQANDRFRRLFGCGPVRSKERLPDLVADRHRQVIVDSLREFAVRQQLRVSMRLRSLRSHSPRSWITIEICRLGSGCAVPYLVYAQPTLARRRLSTAQTRPATSNDVPNRMGDETSGRSSPAESGNGESWPPLLSTLSHELRGSLNAIQGWAAVAESGALPSDRIPGAFRVIKRNAASLAGLVDTLFDLSRNASGSLTLTLELVDLSQLAALVVESTYPVARLHQVSLRLSSARTPLLVKGDRIRLEQVVRNLVDNAIKFTPSGGRVTLRTSSHTPFAELAIRDTGTGMSRELLPVIFDPFRQGGSPVASADVGMGLGLALARELVRLHGGEIEARSAGEGRGSTFIVKLPLAVRSETA